MPLFCAVKPFPMLCQVRRYPKSDLLKERNGIIGPISFINGAPFFEPAKRFIHH